MLGEPIDDISPTLGFQIRTITVDGYAFVPPSFVIDADKPQLPSQHMSEVMPRYAGQLLMKYKGMLEARKRFEHIGRTTSRRRTRLSGSWIRQMRRV